MLACGLATHYVPSAKLSLLEEALTCRVASSTSSICDLASTVSAIIDEYSLKKPALSEKSAYYKKGIIDKCFSKPTVEEILSALEEELTKANTRAGDHKEWEGRVQGIGECLVREYRITCHILQGEISKDCREGCRATLWDKDKKPKWKPSKLELDGDDRDWKELKLPTISKLPVFANSKL
ncbi:3-hydroxyisobutyryl-CoA hydrolase 1-like [Pyrus ussuriensis x Pyrus communis]|uniref:3-hydroxyisobutyryl-CoA hydrolase n=1 Tax=Pyrus ussuriensis x Pyrus communis TaxID=2448454 RepID=A0A5N5F4T8_9ROSA|nr:3-hydroxyisobutyryl-CoA hydrolase 1-like [Pyrus ussuriensis x Pyrus communis]